MKLLIQNVNFQVAIVCAALLDRLKGDQVNITHEQCLEYQELPFKLVGEYMKEMLTKQLKNEI